MCHLISEEAGKNAQLQFLPGRGLTACFSSSLRVQLVLSLHLGADLILPLETMTYCNTQNYWETLRTKTVTRTIQRFER